MKFNIGSSSTFNLVVLVALAIYTSACSEQKKLNEMHDATLEMNKTTKEMADTTKALNQPTLDMKANTVQLLDKTIELHGTIKNLDRGTSDIIKKSDELKSISNNISNISGELYDAARQGDSKASRRASLKSLLDAQTLPAKVAEAATYLASFEYQFWSGIGQDSSIEKRNELMYEAVHEFFMSISDFYDPSVDYSFSATVNKSINFMYSSKESSFYAFSLALHYPNRKQIDLIKHNPQLKLVTMYSMFEEALLLKSKIEAGEIKLSEQPLYIQEILANEKIVTKLLAARINTFGLAFLVKLTDISTGLVQANNMRSKPWIFNPDLVNSAQLEKGIDFLTSANQTKKLMKTIGLSTTKHQVIQSVFSNLRIQKSNKGSKENKALKLKIEHLLAEYIKP